MTGYFFNQRSTLPFALTVTLAAGGAHAQNLAAARTASAPRCAPLALAQAGAGALSNGLQLPLAQPSLAVVAWPVAPLANFPAAPRAALRERVASASARLASQLAVAPDALFDLGQAARFVDPGTIALASGGFGDASERQDAESPSLTGGLLARHRVWQRPRRKKGEPRPPGWWNWDLPLRPERWPRSRYGPPRRVNRPAR